MAVPVFEGVRISDSLFIIYGNRSGLSIILSLFTFGVQIVIDVVVAVHSSGVVRERRIAGEFAFAMVRVFWFFCVLYVL
ncbi:hypothetical protein FNV43_RR06602 [Rhamnella rubrinervis]|uniref:Uncharacterized protein n=1 Tax=Rhamnella rubrinervis TaxID=2594499 RepID=A0A8K0MLL5_9ROSA|nr:hypothetical protein FNV43_RR06602 [Rhamnella rubrinervis]